MSGALLGAALALAGAVAMAQAYPTRSIRVIVPEAPRGLTDISAWLVALKLTDALGQPVAVENRPGAGGADGAAEVARAAPDGNTLLVVSDRHALSPHLSRNPGYDALADFAPVSLLVRAPFVLVVNAGLPARSLKDLLQLAKSRSATVNFATTGPASPARLWAEAFKAAARADVTGVPYRDEEAALAELSGGGVDAMFALAASIAGPLKRGRLRVLAVASEQPIPAMPGVPLMKESYPGFVAYYWVGMLAPVKTPPTVLQVLNSAVVKVLRAEELTTRFGDLGLETVGSTPGELDQWLRRDIERWGRVIRSQKIKIE